MKNGLLDIDVRRISVLFEAETMNYGKNGSIFSRRR